MSGRCIVLIHGLAGSPRTWSRVQPLLEPTATVITPDLCGLGSIEDDALTVARAIRATTAGPATLVGHSRGGLVATAVAELYPGLVERLVLVSAPPTLASRLTARNLSERLLRVPLLGPALWRVVPTGALRRGLGTAFSPDPRVPQFAVDDLARTGHRNFITAGDGIEHYLEAAPLDERVVGLRCPIDVVYGLEDGRVDAAAMARCAARDGVRAFPLAHEGHGAPWTSAGIVADIVAGHRPPTSAITPVRRADPVLDPRPWRPPPIPERAHRTASGEPLASLRRIELPGRGPEDVRVDSQGRIITGIEDGRILRVTLDSSPAVETLADTGGRPLGIAIVDDRTLLVCDSRRGLLKVDIDSGAVTVLVDSVDGHHLNFASNVVRGESGRIYFTASTTRFDFEDYLADLLEHSGTGRVLALEPNGAVRTLVDGIAFANGLSVSRDESLITVAETGDFRLARYRVNGSDVVATTPLVDNLPGFPDNISDEGDLTWISLANPRDRLFDVAARLPTFVRRRAYSVPPSLRAWTATTWVMAVDRDGTVVHDLQESSESFSMVTSVVSTGSHLVLGSITESALAVIDHPSRKGAR
ncbi:alpha/beta fold hydrolase [Williamsia sp. CHRR-6]|uniref:alpha/beta fold hydrolase n=1 Tax=Williamsia sp. CHRR-6 TaxID=2835871 RepID=UPI001BD97FC1|nr:alpha/beta fold hydrolase [Williamsia sp. CHRR-6]MBT0568508.1 alpha/beta fold hydrolase [Williamsia sp. CHRR-6]